MTVTITLPYHGGSWTVDTDHPAAAQNLLSLYGAYCTRGGGGDTVITVRGERVYLDGQPVPAADPMREIHNILYRTKKIVPGIFAMHAGGVCRDGKATVFAASTTTGKTTLIAFLTQSGFSYVSDDCVFVDMETRVVHPFHIPVHLRPGGAEVLKNCGKLPENLTYADERYVFMPRNLSPETMELERICFLERTENENAVLPMDRRDAFTRLLYSPITAYAPDAAYIRFLNSLTPYCEILRYCNMAYVSELIK